jgi:hypothetical protein
MPPLVHRDILPRDLDPKLDPTLSELNARIKELVQQANVQAGFFGTATVYGNLSLAGNRIMNLGAAQADDDALSTTSADPMYSTAVQQAAMEAVGNRMLQTTRRLNDGTQQHTVSSDLNTQGSIPPSNVTGSLTFTTVIGSSITWTWVGVVVQLADLSYKAIQNGTLTVTGLSNALYTFYPYFDTKLGVLTFVAIAGTGSGAPPIAFASASTPAAQQQYADGRIALTQGNTNPATATINGSTGGAPLRTL